ncbi:hypothetical protein DCAR_0728608 [Daucus carota subsp. sativus]|uniref:Uncharacterized protein n=1 Tax=Daucus carota subsp. sativus TaxID=79200 RepID=A0A161Y686_DAUCS|nr:hypothetical protein DCAR_0728608 [Daucus carota subsp. sativus]
MFSPRNPTRRPLQSLRAAFGDDYFMCRFQHVSCYDVDIMFQGMKRDIDTVSENESTGSKKRVGRAALNEFLENRLKNMQDVNTNSTMDRGIAIKFGS